MTGPVLGPRVDSWGKLPEHAMRRQRLVDFFDAVSPPTAVAALEELLVRTRERSVETMQLYVACVDALETAPQVARKLTEWLAAADAAGAVEVRFLLIRPSSARAAAEDETVLHPDFAELTLGERKARSRRAQADDLGKFLHETDPRVLEILLQHPRVDEAWVIRWVSRRPQRPEAIQTLVRVPRWLMLPAVRRAVALNPYAPPPLQLKLLPLMNREELADVARGLDLHADVHAYAEALLRLKRYADSRDFLGSVAAGEDVRPSS